MTGNEQQDKPNKLHVDVQTLFKDVLRHAAGFAIAVPLIRSTGSVEDNYQASVKAKTDVEYIAYNFKY